MNYNAVRKMLRPMSDDEFAAWLRAHAPGGVEDPDVVTRVQADYARIQHPVFDSLSAALESTVPNDAGFGKFRATAVLHDEAICFTPPDECTEWYDSEAALFAAVALHREQQRAADGSVFNVENTNEHSPREAGH